MHITLDAAALCLYVGRDCKCTLMIFFCIFNPLQWYQISNFEFYNKLLALSPLSTTMAEYRLKGNQKPILAAFRHKPDWSLDRMLATGRIHDMESYSNIFYHHTLHNSFYSFTEDTDIYQSVFCVWHRNIILFRPAITINNYTVLNTRW